MYSSSPPTTLPAIRPGPPTDPAPHLFLPACRPCLPSCTARARQRRERCKVLAPFSSSCKGCMCGEQVKLQPPLISYTPLLIPLPPPPLPRYSMYPPPKLYDPFLIFYVLHPKLYLPHLIFFVPHLIFYITTPILNLTCESAVMPRTPNWHWPYPLG